MVIKYLKQKMQNLNLYGTIDTCICTLDSINHITKEEDVTKAFERTNTGIYSAVKVKILHFLL